MKRNRWQTAVAVAVHTADKLACWFARQRDTNDWSELHEQHRTTEALRRVHRSAA